MATSPEELKIINYLQLSAEYLRSQEVSNSRFEAEQLLAHVMNCSRLDIYLQYDNYLDPKQVSLLRGLLKKRVSGLSLPHILGKSYFWTFELLVNKNVLIPRKETEILVQAILDLNTSLEFESTLQILELGTGSGAISLALGLELKNANIIASDISVLALEVASQNIATFKLQLEAVHSQITLLASDGFTKLNENKCFDLVVSNPPYIKTLDIVKLDQAVQSEPKIALDGGDDGLKFYHHLAQTAWHYLNPQGFLCFEHGYDQKPDILDIFKKQKVWQLFKEEKDYSNHDRVLIYRFKSDI